MPIAGGQGISKAPSQCGQTENKHRPEVAQNTHPKGEIENNFGRLRGAIEQLESAVCHMQSRLSIALRNDNNPISIAPPEEFASQLGQELSALTYRIDYLYASISDTTNRIEL